MGTQGEREERRKISGKEKGEEACKMRTKRGIDVVESPAVAQTVRPQRWWRHLVGEGLRRIEWECEVEEISSTTRATAFTKQISVTPPNSTGPGCSSLGGAMLEIGPFFVNRDNKTLSRNKYAWNNVANMLFLESPAGVGFSYSNRTSDYNNTGDRSTAADAYTFLINWLERFPEYKGRRFFITGESYGGHYIPQLANTILSNNKIMNTTMVNLKGVAIGNAYLDDDTNTRATIDYYWTHAMISKETHKAVQENCSFNRTYTGLCRTAIEEANNEKGLIDQSNIYASFCWDASAPQQQHASVTNIDPCASYYMQSYLNRQEVQRAFHANTTGLKQPWSDCSGDIDAVCPVTSTLYSLDILGLQINSSWRAWYSDDNEVGGYVVEYKGLVFATVRGAGHMVPTYQPQRALTLFSSFLQGKLPPE
ncbi:hypothetical protein C2845_PM02G24550 [Panicum miliaceum]|uniref:Carboxypeptidase n=1 Tax=Panicum miliaceum TaxID=4540 RepID=A0A3L6S821_PANMI|nr:hypothetical protein C2845_PM02G24550 [Panicum miliaceum]